MKKILMLVVSMCFLATACQKEELSNPSKLNTDSDPVANQEVKEKRSASAQTQLTQMGQAAGMKSISYSNGAYQIEFYRTTDIYTVTINSFDEEVLIDFTTSIASNTHQNSIDVGSELINLGGVGNFTFANFQNYTISETEPILKNAAIVISVHHALNANQFSNFPDNGSTDIFPTNNFLKFWGWGKVDDGSMSINGGPCMHHYHQGYFVFGIEVKSLALQSEPC